MGNQVIIRLIESLPNNISVGGAVFVAGFLKRLTNLEDDDIVRDVVKHWLETPIDLVKVQSHLLKAVAIFSDNDPYVPMDNQDLVRDQLNAKIIIEHNKGHFSGNDSDQTFNLPIVLETINELINP